MLQTGMIEMTRVERLALDQLLETHGKKAGISRSEPNEQGPLVVSYEDKTFLVHPDGKVSTSG